MLYIVRLGYPLMLLVGIYLVWRKGDGPESAVPMLFF
jgi:hypothetical protein